MTPQPTELDVRLMREAIALASRGRGYVEPNPMVGCVVHKAGEVIGKGFHRQFGQTHAEPNALADCTQPPAGATAVVTLEPCCHTSKKTPPCVPALIAAGVSRVVVGQIDPNPQVAGKGIAQLRAAGIEVVTGILEQECQQLNAAFYALMKLRRPYITLKWAQSADGFIGGPNRSRRQISSPISAQLIHMLRTRSDAIAVTSDTVIRDDPTLTVRHAPVIRTPIRVVLDTHLRTPPEARVLMTPPDTLVFTSAKPVTTEVAAAILHVPLSGGHLDLAAVLLELGRMNLTHLLIEPGERLARSLIGAGCWDRLWVFRSLDRIADPSAPRAPDAPGIPIATRSVGPDTFEEYLNPSSPAYFAPIASPEFALVVS